MSLRAASIGAAIACACVLAPALAGAAEEAGPDTIGVHIEDGAGVDVTNEQYYEDAFLDTTFLGRRLQSTPETRVARMLSVEMNGTRGQRATRYQLRHDLSLGDKVQRGSLALAWRQELDPDWRLHLNPSVEYRHDRTFDRDLEEWRAALGGRLRRSFSGGETVADLGGLADLVRSSGDGDTFLLDRNSARLSLGLDHSSLAGEEWRLGYQLVGRMFPDSTERDHLEHGWDARIKHTFPGAHTLALEISGARRQTLQLVPTSRDNYWEGLGAIEGEWRATPSLAVRLRGEGELFRYDVEDSVLFFDYHVGRARLDLRRESERNWTLGVGPRVERLGSAIQPGESYWETGGGVELEYFGARSWWSVAPAAGWREYDEAPLDLATGYSGLHSSYAFYEVSAFVDQPLPKALRIRGIVTLRGELHTDSAQDAFSTHVSTQLRWLAR